MMTPSVENIHYVAPLTVAKFAQSDAVVRLLIGPYGSGKSVGCCMEVVRRACQQEPNNRGIRETRFAIVRNTYRQLRDTTINTWLEWFPAPQWGRYYSSRYEYILEIPMPDGTRVRSEILFRALDTKEDEHKLLSLELTGAWFNEFREIPLSLLLAMLGRTNRYPSRRKPPGPTWTGVFGDSNPPDKNSDYFKLMEAGEVPLVDQDGNPLEINKDEHRPFFEKFRQPSGRSPEAENLDHLAPDYYTNMVALARLRGDDDNWIKVHVDGEYGYTPAGEPIYKGSYNPAIHVKDNLIVDKTRVVGVGYDPGLAWTAAVIGQMDAKGRWRIFREVVERNVTVDQMIRAVRKVLQELGVTDSTCPVPVWFADPAAKQRSLSDKRAPRDIIRANGYTVVLGEKGTDTRINAVRATFNTLVEGIPRMQIDPSCIMLIEGMNGEYYMREVQGANGRIEQKPVKNDHSHVQDALQYLVSPFEVPRDKGGLRKWPEPPPRHPWAVDGYVGGVEKFNPHTAFRPR